MFRNMYFDFRKASFYFHFGTKYKNNLIYFKENKRLHLHDQLNLFPHKYCNALAVSLLNCGPINGLY